jgi:hypothetical protein
VAATRASSRLRLLLARAGNDFVIADGISGAAAGARFEVQGLIGGFERLWVGPQLGKNGHQATLDPLLCHPVIDGMQLRFSTEGASEKAGDAVFHALWGRRCGSRLSVPSEGGMHNEENGTYGKYTQRGVGAAVFAHAIVTVNWLCERLGRGILAARKQGDGASEEQ